MINYAHRGASAYAPENTMTAFGMGVQMGANGIETDVQRTRDGVLVLHHDTTLKRTAGIDRCVSEMTWREISALDVGRWKADFYSGERIVRLEDFLYYFGGKPLRFAIEIKQPGIEKETLASVRRYLTPERYTITSFRLESLLTLAGEGVRLGYLTAEFSPELLERLRDAGIAEYCPDARTFTGERARAVRDCGLGLRAWGVRDAALMNAMADMGVDGMTVNFPDMLAERMRRDEHAAAEDGGMYAR